MPRNPKIEAILEAWWNAEHDPQDGRAAALQRFNQILDETIGAQPLTRDWVREYLYDRYLDYKRDRKKREKIAVAQSAGLGKSE